METMTRTRRDARPLSLKLGVAFALSIAGILVSRLRRRRRMSPPPPSSPLLSANRNINSSSLRDSGRCNYIKDELHILKKEQDLVKIINNKTPATHATTTIVGMPPAGKSSKDDEEFLLPEINDLVAQEFKSLRKGRENLTCAPCKKVFTREKSGIEEIAHLHEIVQSLQELEHSLELRLLEYYGMHEIEGSVKELQSELKIKSVESKLYLMKIESLQADKQRLLDQLSEYSWVVKELETVKATITLLKKKSISDDKQAQECILGLQRKVALLQEKGHKGDGDDVQVKKLKRIKELEEETAILRNANSELAFENSELLFKLESTKSPESSSCEGPQANVLEETNQLRQSNAELTKEIDQLKTDRFADVEELVYLKWINACLRYELRNYEPSPGKIMARDLSKNLSPKSKEKAKLLILEYANAVGDEKNFCLPDSECGYSFSHASIGESDDSSFNVTMKNGTTSKSKFLSKLRKLVVGKEFDSNKISIVETSPSYQNSERRVSSLCGSFDDVQGRDARASSLRGKSVTNNHSTEREKLLKDQNKKPLFFPRILTRHSLDNQIHGKNDLGSNCGRYKQRKSDVGASLIRRQTVTGGRSSIDTVPDILCNHNSDDAPEKAELKRFANILKSSRYMAKQKKRSTSFSH